MFFSQKRYNCREDGLRMDKEEQMGFFSIVLLFRYYLESLEEFAPAQIYIQSIYSIYIFNLSIYVQFLYNVALYITNQKAKANQKPNWGTTNIFCSLETTIKSIKIKKKQLNPWQHPVLM